MTMMFRTHGSVGLLSRFLQHVEHFYCGVSMPARSGGMFQWGGPSKASSPKRYGSGHVKPPPSNKVIPVKDTATAIDVPTNETASTADSACSLSDDEQRKGSGKKIDIAMGVLHSTVGFERLDLRDYEYRAFTAHLDQYKLRRYDDKIYVGVICDALIQHNIFKSQVEGASLCRRIASNPEALKDNQISIGDLLHAARFNKKPEGEMVRKLIRRISDNKSDNVMRSDTGNEVTSSATANAQNLRAGERRTSSFGLAMRKIITRFLSSESTDSTSVKPALDGTVPTQSDSDSSAPPRGTAAAETAKPPKPRRTSTIGNSVRKIITRLLSSDKWECNEIKAQQSLQSVSFHPEKSAAQKVSRLQVVMKDEEQCTLSAEEQQQIDDYMKQFEDDDIKELSL